MLEQQYPWGRFYTLPDPIPFNALGEVLEDIWSIEHRQERSESADIEESRLVGKSRALKEVRKLTSQVAASMATVLITGQSGTGKEVVAREIHDMSGRTGSFVAVNCGAIPEHLLESELFGHARGAFTGATSTRMGRFELASNGTLFLDEIGDMPLAMQVKLLRVLQEKVLERVGSAKTIETDVRVIAATHRDLPAMIKEGSFREDLYYRLSVFPIEIPPLNERRDDIEPLLNELINRVWKKHRIWIRFTSDAIRVIENYAWPGNVRELANFVERLAVIHPDGDIGPQDLPWPLRAENAEEKQDAPVIIGNSLARNGHPGDTEFPKDGMDLKEHLAHIEISLIETALEQSDGVVQKAAELLGLSRTTLVEKIKRYSIRN